jgi:hypothetical protein
MTVSNALDSARRILIGLKCPASSGSGNFATGTTLETFHEAEKHPDVMEILNLCVKTGRMDERKIVIKGINYS